MATTQTKTQKDITDQLYEMRAEAGLTQKQLSKKLGWAMGSGNVSKYELGVKNPQLDMLVRWATACGFKVEVKISSKDELDKSYVWVTEL